jgi:hypothetical protein
MTQVEWRGDQGRAVPAARRLVGMVEAKLRAMTSTYVCGPHACFLMLEHAISRNARQRQVPGPNAPQPPSATSKPTFTTPSIPSIVFFALPDSAIRDSRRACRRRVSSTWLLRNCCRRSLNRQAGHSTPRQLTRDVRAWGLVQGTRWGNEEDPHISRQE